MKLHSTKMNSESTRTVIWISIIVLFIVMTSEFTFGVISRNANKQVEIYREEIRRNEERIKIVEKIAIENEKVNAVIINELKNFDKELNEIKELLRGLQK